MEGKYKKEKKNSLKNYKARNKNYGLVIFNSNIRNPNMNSLFVKKTHNHSVYMF